MIRSITVTNYLGDSIKLDLAKPELSGFAVVDVTGLGPGKATINTTELSTMHGGLYNSSKLPSRNIVLSLRFLWTPTIEASRQRSYRYFPIMKNLTLRVETDNRVAEIDGYVESNEPVIFSNEEGADISIICPNPFFYSAGDNGVNTTVFSAIDPMFEFPFSNESLTSNLIEFGSYRSTTDQVIVYEGDSEIGITIRIRAAGEASNITIWNTETRESMSIDTTKIESLTGAGITAGDEIVICTLDSQKSIKLIRDGETTNILNCLSKYADWFKLSRGENSFAYTAETGTTNLQFQIENRIIYEGV